MDHDFASLQFCNNEIHYSFACACSHRCYKQYSVRMIPNEVKGVHVEVTENIIFLFCLIVVLLLAYFCV